jgi:hypothetical protein
MIIGYRKNATKSITEELISTTCTLIEELKNPIHVHFPKGLQMKLLKLQKINKRVQYLLEHCSDEGNIISDAICVSNNDELFKLIDYAKKDFSENYADGNSNFALFSKISNEWLFERDKLKQSYYVIRFIESV